MRSCGPGLYRRVSADENRRIALQRAKTSVRFYHKELSNTGDKYSYPDLDFRRFVYRS